ncbi:MAG: polysaccharide pyruvyl transferase family protein [Candidatus Sulfotelmatobacter sp.]
MRVIVGTSLNDGDAEYKNMGDVAMLQVAVARLLKLWPDARIAVLTDSPAGLARYCPGAIPLSRIGCRSWVDDRIVLGRLHEFLPAGISTALSRLKRSVRLRWPALLTFVLERRLGLLDGGGRRDSLRTFLESLRTADVFAVCGSGGFADSCRAWNLFILNAMETALYQDIPVVMFGQGMGPLSDTDVLARAQKVLPRVMLITLRGSRGGASLLDALGVSPAKVLTTGDEATELAYAAAGEPGTQIGINLRVAAYSPVSSDAVAMVGGILREFARRQGVSLLPVPIAFHDCADDRETIRQLLSESDQASDGADFLDSPAMLIEQVARCRIVVTGAYHAAVFALGQGIPVVCLVSSEYYVAKFQGLADLYETGCTIVQLDQPEAAEGLAHALECTWSAADTLRAPLLRSAGWQVKQSREAYQKIRELLDAPAEGSAPCVLNWIVNRK